MSFIMSVVFISYFKRHKHRYKTENVNCKKLSEQKWMTLLQNHCETTVLEKMSSQTEIKDDPLIKVLRTLLNLLNTYNQEQSKTELFSPGEVEADERVFKTYHSKCSRI